VKEDDKGNEVIFIVRNKRTGQPIDLTEATGVKVILENSAGQVLERDATIYDAALGRVAYTMQESDLAVPGNLSIEVRVLFGENKSLTSSRVVEKVLQRLE
jgi:hypothetical protein